VPTGHICSPDDIVSRAEALGPISLLVSQYHLPSHRRRVITSKYQTSIVEKTLLFPEV